MKGEKMKVMSFDISNVKNFYSGFIVVKEGGDFVGYGFVKSETGRPESPRLVVGSLFCGKNYSTPDGGVQMYISTEIPGNVFVFDEVASSKKYLADEVAGFLLEDRFLSPKAKLYQKIPVSLNDFGAGMHNYCEADVNVTFQDVREGGGIQKEIASMCSHIRDYTGVVQQMLELAEKKEYHVLRYAIVDSWYGNIR